LPRLAFRPGGACSSYPTRLFTRGSHSRFELISCSSLSGSPIVGPAREAVYGGVIALLAVWVLFNTQLDGLDGMTRAVTDLLWTGEQARPCSEGWRRQGGLLQRAARDHALGRHGDRLPDRRHQTAPRRGMFFGLLSEARPWDTDCFFWRFVDRVRLSEPFVSASASASLAAFGFAMASDSRTLSVTARVPSSSAK
jgi:hypothetical protein